MRALVALGGALGATARVAVDAALPTGAGGFPTATLLVNLTGAFALALLVRSTDDPALRAGLGTGLLGAWTTFSALAVQGSDLLTSAPIVALAYLVATVLGGVLAVRLATRLVPASATSTPGGTS